MNTTQALEQLFDGYNECSQDVQSWGAYADDYFQKKWDLEGCINTHKKTLEACKQALEKQTKPEAWKYTTHKVHNWITKIKPLEDTYDEGTLTPLYTIPPDQSAEIERLKERERKLIDAVNNLIKVKGRHNTEIAMNLLIDLIKEIEADK